MKAIKLSVAEMQVVERIALGESKKEVANHTHRSVYTVETTVKNAYAKLGFSKVSDLVIWYISQKFHLEAEIEHLKKQVLACALLLLVCFEIGFLEDEFLRARRLRRQKEQETEIVI